MSIEVVISTYRDSISNVPGVLATIPRTVPVLVMHQICPGAIYDYGDVLDGRTRIEAIPGSGLAKSRNRGLERASASIVVPTDDDVRFLPGAFESIESAFMTWPAADIITFQVVDLDGRLLKNYGQRSFKHGLRTIRRVFSIEIALRRSAFVDKGLRWDERFGLNADFPGGLELAMMKNALVLGLHARHAPISIISHPRESTGHSHTSASAYFRGAVYAKLFGLAAYPLLAVFALKNAGRAGRLPDAVAYVRQLYKGATVFRSLERGSR